MRSVTYSMGVSLDGYIVGPDGGFNWTAPDEEVFRFWIDEIREVGVHLMGRRLYETMLYWETADQNPLQKGLHPRVGHVAALSEPAEASIDSLVRGPGYLEPRPGPGTNSTSSRRRWSLRFGTSAAITGFLSLFVRASIGGFSLQ